MKDCLQRDGWLLSASRTLTAPIDDNSPDAIEQLDARIRHINLICRLLTNGIKLPEVDKFKRAALQLEWDARNHSRSVDGSDKQGEQQQQLHEAWTSVAEKAHTLSDSLTQTASIQASTILSRPSTGASSTLSLSRGSVHSLSPLRLYALLRFLLLSSLHSLYSSFSYSDISFLSILSLL